MAACQLVETRGCRCEDAAMPQAHPRPADPRQMDRTNGAPSSRKMSALSALSSMHALAHVYLLQHGHSQCDEIVEINRRLFRKVRH